MFSYYQKYLIIILFIIIVFYFLNSIPKNNEHFESKKIYLNDLESLNKRKTLTRGQILFLKNIANGIYKSTPKELALAKHILNKNHININNLISKNNVYNPNFVKCIKNNKLYHVFDKNNTCPPGYENARTIECINKTERIYVTGTNPKCFRNYIKNQKAKEPIPTITMHNKDISDNLIRDKDTIHSSQDLYLNNILGKEEEKEDDIREIIILLNNIDTLDNKIYEVSYNNSNLNKQDKQIIINNSNKIFDSSKKIKEILKTLPINLINLNSEHKILQNGVKELYNLSMTTPDTYNFRKYKIISNSMELNRKNAELNNLINILSHSTSSHGLSNPTVKSSTASTSVSSNPTVSPPVASNSVASPPVVSPPVTSPPVSSNPVTSPPVTSPPVVSPPVASPPVTSPPVSSNPTVSPPVVSTPVASTPVASTPVASTPVASTPVASPPVTSPPVVSPPVASPPISSNPRVRGISPDLTTGKCPDGYNFSMGLCYQSSPAPISTTSVSDTVAPTRIIPETSTITYKYILSPFGKKIKIPVLSSPTPVSTVTPTIPVRPATPKPTISNNKQELDNLIKDIINNINNIYSKFGNIQFAKKSGMITLQKDINTNCGNIIAILSETTIDYRKLKKEIFNLNKIIKDNSGNSYIKKIKDDVLKLNSNIIKLEQYL